MSAHTTKRKEHAVRPKTNEPIPQYDLDAIRSVKANAELEKVCMDIISKAVAGEGSFPKRLKKAIASGVLGS